MTESRRPEVRRAYLLAGHASRLPGKFALRIDGEPIAVRAARALERAGLSVAVVSVLPIELEGRRCLRDRFDAGPLGGVATILADTQEPFFLFGADMPFIDPMAVRALGTAFEGRTLVPVAADGHWAVLHALYAHLDPERVRALLARGAGLRDLVQEQLAGGAALLLPPGTIPERSLTDVDTAEEYERLQRN